MTQPRIQKMFMTEPVDRALGEPTNRQKPQTSVDPVQTFNNGNKPHNGMTKPATSLPPLPKPTPPSKDDGYKVEVWEPEKPAEFDPGMCYVADGVTRDGDYIYTFTLSGLSGCSRIEVSCEPEEDISVEEFEQAIGRLLNAGVTRREMLEELDFCFDVDETPEAPETLTTPVATYTREEFKVGLDKGREDFLSQPMMAGPYKAGDRVTLTSGTWANGSGVFGCKQDMPEVFRSRRDEPFITGPHGQWAGGYFKPSDHVAEDPPAFKVGDRVMLDGKHEAVIAGLGELGATCRTEYGDSSWLKCHISHAPADPPGAIMAHPMFRAGGH
jgi:hypothetical protein